ncbi:MAG: hypothetical protein VX237_00180 [Chloroflexota bacterium]|nr:hypothetical protein [Chloroflexota bacterium]
MSKYIYVTQGHIDKGVAGSDTHCPVALAVIDSTDEEKYITFHVAVDCHTPVSVDCKTPMLYSIKVNTHMVTDDGDGITVEETDLILLNQEVTDWIKLFDSCEWHDDDDNRLQPITIEVYNTNGNTRGRLYDDRYQKRSNG